MAEDPTVVDVVPAAASVTAPVTPTADVRSFDQLIAYARDLVTTDKGMKKSEVLAFMKELVSVVDAGTAPAIESSTPENHEGESEPVGAAALDLDSMLSRFADEPGRFKPELTSTGAVFLPLIANGYYTRAQGLRLAGLLVRALR